MASALDLGQTNPHSSPAKGCVVSLDKTVSIPLLNK